MTLKKRARTDWIVVHCAATPEGLDIGRAEIDRWHRQKGWLMIGYHYVIRLDGTVEIGREEEAIGAHVEGHNSTSIGISLVGGTDAKGTPKDTFTTAQYAALAELIIKLKAKYPSAQVLGHRDFSPDRNKNGKVDPDEWIKACPSFDVREWLQATGVLLKSQPVKNPPKTSAQPGWKYHLIVKGDTLFSLARANATTVDAIIALNPKTNVKALPVGVSIRVK